MGPLFVMEDIETTPRRTLFTLGGVPWRITPRGWLSQVAMLTLGLIAGLIFMGGDLAASLIFGLLLIVSYGLHSLGHIISARMVGAPMDELLITATRPVNIYRNDPPDLPSRAHMGRAIGGPALNLLAGALGLALAVAGGGSFALFFGLLNSGLGLGSLLPVPSVDGEIILRELRRHSH